MQRHPPAAAGVAGDVELSACDVVETAPAGIGRLEVPAALSKHASVRPRPDDLPDEKIVGLLIVRLGDEPTNEPGRAPSHQRRGVPLLVKKLHPAALQLVRIFGKTAAADGLREAGLQNSRHLERKVPALFHQLACLAFPAQQDRDLGRRVIESACHAAAMTLSTPS